MTAQIRRVAGTDRAVVYHHCGTRMQHLQAYLIGNAWASDWWCNKCAEAVDLLGDEENPRQFPRQVAP